jgi:acyl-homoserine lactone synthase
MRILKTDRPHLLDTVFPMLCADGVPSGPEYRELTRLCISPRLRAVERLRIRNRLFTSLVEYALLTGIVGYTGVSEMGVYQQMLALGWRCTPLGLPQVVNGQTVGAILAHVEPDTIRRFQASGTYDSGVMQTSKAA